MLLGRTCKEICARLIASQDKRLALPDRVAVQLHLLACEVCPKFERQLLTMRNDLKRWRNYSSEDD
jgi:hypothetical protein